MRIIICLAISLYFLNIVNAQWQQCNIPTFRKYRAIAADSTNVYTGYYDFAYDFGFVGNFYSSNDNGSTWVDSDTGLIDENQKLAMEILFKISSK